MTKEELYNDQGEKLELHKSDGGDFYTNPKYWDCECDADYIHKKTEHKHCAKCDTSHEEQPDSRQNEIDAINKRYKKHYEGLAQQDSNLWSVHLEAKFKNILFDCKEDEIEKYVQDFIISEMENFDWTYEKADIKNKTMLLG